MSDRTVRALLDESGDWDAVKWWRLEQRAFAREPFVQASIATLGPQEARRTETRVTLGSFLKSLAILLSIALPTLAAGMMIQWATRGQSPWDMPLGYAGPILAFAFVVSLFGAFESLRRRRASAWGSLIVIAIVNIVPAAIVLIIGLTAAAPYLEGTGYWLAVAAAHIALHVFLLARGPIPRGGPRNEVENVDQALTEVPESRREEARAERDAAIRELVARGSISADEAERASAAPLGKLGMTMAPEVMSPRAKAALGGVGHLS